MGNGARGIALGESNTGGAEGVEANYWNPAGLGVLPHAEVTLTHADLFDDTALQYAAGAFPLERGRRGAVGISATRLSVENIPARDASNAALGGDVSQEDMSLQLSYGVRVGPARPGVRDGLRLGVGLKRISQKLAGVSASAVAFDVGAQFRPGAGVAGAVGEWARRTSWGVAAVNLGKGPTFDREETPLPQATRAGVAYTHFLRGDALTLTSDYVWAGDGTRRLGGGAEFWLRNLLAFRAGYNQGQDVGDRIRLGAGFRFQALQIDYALARFGEALGDTHRFTLTMRFGEGAVATRTGLKSDLVRFYLGEARTNLADGAFHTAIINANHVLEVDPRNPQALHMLFDAGEKLRAPGPLPASGGGSDAPRLETWDPAQPAFPAAPASPVEESVPAGEGDDMEGTASPERLDLDDERNEEVQE